MIALKDIQTNLRTLLEAEAALAGEVIVLGATATLLSIATVARASDVATIVTATPHRLITGARVDIAGVTSADFALQNAEVTVTNTNTFTVACPGDELATTADATGTVRVLETILAETALETLGHVITIFPPIAADTLSQARGKALLDASAVVRVDVNLAKATKEAMQLVTSVISAIITPACQPPETYRLDDPAIVIDDTDPGLLSYLIYFKRQAQF